MYINKAEIQYAIDKAHEITEHYQLNYLGAKDTEKSVDDLREICEKYLEKKVEYYEHIITYADQPIRGFCLTYPDHHEVVLLAGQNHCWSRLVTCKELFHVIMDKDEYKNPSVAQLIDETTVAFPDPESHPNHPVAAEFLAEIAAMEFLFPYPDRINIINTQPAGQLPDFLAIAHRYRVPRVLVEKFLSAPFIQFLNPDNYQ